MPNNLIRVTYVSTLHPHVTDQDIDDLVAKAASYNKAHNITGALAIDGDRVCQILEGPTAGVDTLYASIERDSRHHGIVQLEYRRIEKTVFESWGMARRKMVDIVMFALAN